MKIMPCPLNGPRNIQEFICAGPVEPHPDPNRCSDEEWTEFVWMEENVAGVVREWWCHVATAYWFIAERNTVTDEILATYPADRVFSERVTFEPLAPPPEATAAPVEAKPESAAETTPPPEAPAAPAETAPEAPTEPAALPETQPAPAEAAPDAPAEAAPADDVAEGGTSLADAPAEETPSDDAPADGPPGARAADSGDASREPKDPAA